MPEMTFLVQWPDDSLQECYSPSLVMHDHLTAGASYPVHEFVRLTSAALDQASDRVREKYGFSCTSAAAQKEDIQKQALRFTSIHDKALAEPETTGNVRVLAMEPSLPNTTDNEKALS